jgi:uncharacterized protein YchJ
VLGTIIYFEENYFLINGFATNYERKLSISHASKLIRFNPELLVQDNPEKRSEIDQYINKIYDKFIEVFKTDTIITSEEYSDLITDNFLSYINTDDAEWIEDIDEELIEPPYDDLSYSNHDYDFEDEPEDCSEIELINDGIFVDKRGGLYNVLGFATFREIFRNPDYKSIRGYKECIRDYIYERDVDYPAIAVLKTYEETQDKEEFLNIIKEALDDEEFENMDLLEILKESKGYDPDKYTISSTIISLFSSTLQEDDKNDELELNELFNLYPEDDEEEDEEEENYKKVGRNDPCPCGSGKKYK